jgi:hypothetical protein
MKGIKVVIRIMNTAMKKGLFENSLAYSEDLN